MIIERQKLEEPKEKRDIKRDINDLDNKKKVSNLFKRDIDLRKSLLLKQTEKILESKIADFNKKAATDVNVESEWPV